MELNCDWRTLQEVLKPIQHLKAKTASSRQRQLSVDPELILTQPSYWAQVKAARGATELGFLERLSRWPAKLLPPVYGIYLAFESQPRGFLFVFRKGQLESYFVPDLSGLNAVSPERAKSVDEVVRYLSENKMMPIQGVALTRQDWERWSGARKPWRELRKALLKKHARLVPFRWGAAAIIALVGK